MLSDVNKRVWGVNIKPSTRKSIHAGCSSCINNMGKYGCRSKERQVNAGPNQGTDEVDNVMSKPAHPYRPAPTKKSVSRRDSIDVPELNDSDETDEDVLSKSSLATFFSCPFSSDNELYSSALQSHNTSRNEWQTSTNNSPMQDRNTQSSIYERSSSQNGYSLGYIPESTRITSAFNPSTREKSDYETLRGRSKFKYLGFILVIAAVAIGVNSDYFSPTIDTENDIFSNDVIFYDHISSLGAKYKVGSDAIIRLKSGISTILKNQDAASFMLIYDSKAESFNSKILYSFIEELALKTVKYLRNQSNSIQNVIVDTNQIETESELRALQSEVEKTGVMIVPNINNVPSDLAMAFHYYCDEYNPLVKSSAIFFTLDASSCLHGKQVTHTFIEKCLLSKWNDIHKDKIGPLLTRVVNVIVDITNIKMEVPLPC